MMYCLLWRCNLSAHGLHMYLDLLLPCLLDESHLQLCSSFWLHLPLMKTRTQHVPGMYDMRHIRMKFW